MACIPNHHSFTPCQLGALGALKTDAQRKQFAESVGLSHELERLEAQAKNGVSTLENYQPLPPG